MKIPTSPSPRARSVSRKRSIGRSLLRGLGVTALVLIGLSAASVFPKMARAQSTNILMKLESIEILKANASKKLVFQLETVNVANFQDVKDYYVFDSPQVFKDRNPEFYPEIAVGGEGKVRRFKGGAILRAKAGAKDDYEIFCDGKELLPGFRIEVPVKDIIAIADELSWNGGESSMNVMMMLMEYNSVFKDQLALSQTYPVMELMEAFAQSKEPQYFAPVEKKGGTGLMFRMSVSLEGE